MEAIREIIKFVNDIKIFRLVKYCSDGKELQKGLTRLSKQAKRRQVNFSVASMYSNTLREK